MVLSAQSLVSTERPTAFLVFPIAVFRLCVLGWGRASHIRVHYPGLRVPVHPLAYTVHDECWCAECYEQRAALPATLLPTATAAVLSAATATILSAL